MGIILSIENQSSSNNFLPDSTLLRKEENLSFLVVEIRSFLLFAVDYLSLFSCKNLGTTDFSAA
jgi:hypothetical protein